MAYQASSSAGCSSSESSIKLFDSPVGTPERSYELVDLLHVKETVSYTIPNFSVITVQLRHVVVGVWDDKVDAVRHFDAFMQHSFNIPEAPTSIEIVESCNIEVSVRHNEVAYYTIQ